MVESEIVNFENKAISPRLHFGNLSSGVKLRSGSFLFKGHFKLGLFKLTLKFIPIFEVKFSIWKQKFSKWSIINEPGRGGPWSPPFNELYVITRFYAKSNDLNKIFFTKTSWSNLPVIFIFDRYTNIPKRWSLVNLFDSALRKRNLRRGPFRFSQNRQIWIWKNSA